MLLFKAGGKLLYQASIKDHLGFCKGNTNSKIREIRVAFSKILTGH